MRTRRPALSGVIVRRIVKLNGPTNFDVDNANGGGVYTIKHRTRHEKLPSGC
jgi:hypothetical protein